MKLTRGGSFWVALLSLGLISCGEFPLRDAARSLATGIHAATAVVEGTDVSQMRFVVTRVPCQDEVIEPFSAHQIKLLEDQRLPGGVPLFENAPLDEDSAHFFSDHFFVVPVGCYDVWVSALTAAGELSADCLSGTASGVVVNEGLTTEILLLLQCAGRSGGGLDIIGALNRPPRITNLTFTPSKFIDICAPATICVTAKDPDRDPLEFVWQTVGDGPVIDPTTIVETVLEDGSLQQCVEVGSDEVGTYQFVVTVYDLLRVEGNLVRIEDWLKGNGIETTSHDFREFPLHVALPESGTCDPLVPCETHADCGTDGFIDSRFCVGDDIYQPYRTYTCVNPGTPASFCRSEVVDRLIDTCGGAYCDPFGPRYCVGNEVYRDRTCYDEGCENGACVTRSRVETVFIERCVGECIDGECIDPVCLVNSDCGIDGHLNEPFCVGQDRYDRCVTWECRFPGTAQAECVQTIEPCFLEHCPDACDDGQCVTIGCRENSECGTDGFIDGRVCIDNRVFGNYILYTCLNPGTAASHCTSRVEQRFIEQCGLPCCDDFGVPYCRDGHLYQSRFCYDQGCLNGACFSGTRQEEQRYATCQRGCAQGACIPPPATEISIVKSGPQFFRAGQTVIYTLVVRNPTSSVTQTTRVSDPVPYGLVFLPAQSSPGCALNAGGDVVVCDDQSTIAAGATIIYTLAFSVSAAVQCDTAISNQATLAVYPIFSKRCFLASTGGCVMTYHDTDTIHTVVVCSDLCPPPGGDDPPPPGGDDPPAPGGDDP